MKIQTRKYIRRHYDRLKDVECVLSQIKIILTTEGELNLKETNTIIAKVQNCNDQHQIMAKMIAFFSTITVGA